MKEGRNEQTSDQQERDAPAVLRRLRKIAVWVLPMVPFINFSLLLCSLFLTLTTCRKPSQVTPSYLQDKPSSPSPSHLKKEAGSRVHEWRHELPKRDVVGRGTEDGESGPLLQRLQPQIPKEGGWDASSCLPRTGVPTHLVEAPAPQEEDVFQGDFSCWAAGRGK